MHAPLEGISDCLHSDLPLSFSKWKINSPLPNVAAYIRFCALCPEASLSRVTGHQLLTHPLLYQCWAGWEIQRTRRTCWHFGSVCSTPWKGALLGEVACKWHHLRMQRSFCPLLDPLGLSHRSRFCSTINIVMGRFLSLVTFKKASNSASQQAFVYFWNVYSSLSISGWLLVGRTLLSSCRKLEWK